MLHSLEYFPAPQTFYERLLALLALPSMDLDPTAGAVRMAETEWSLVRSAVERGDAGAASALLAGAGMSSPVAQRLVWLLGGVPELAVLALVDDPGLPARRTLECTLLLDESGGIGLLTQPDEQRRSSSRRRPGSLRRRSSTCCLLANSKGLQCSFSLGCVRCAGPPCGPSWWVSCC